MNECICPLKEVGGKPGGEKRLYREYGLYGHYTDYWMTERQHKIKGILLMVFIGTAMVAPFVGGFLVFLWLK